MPTRTQTGTSRRLTGARRHALLTIHIGASVALLGTSAGLLVIGAHAASRDPNEAHTIYALTHLLVFTLDIPFAVIALLSGVWLALASKWRLFRYWWVTAKLALLLGTIIIGAAVIRPNMNSALHATGRGNTSELPQRLLIAAPAAQLTMMLAATILGVFKPFGRLSSQRTALPHSS